MADIRATVKRLLVESTQDGGDALRDLARRFDKWDREVRILGAAIKDAAALLSEQRKTDIRFA